MRPLHLRRVLRPRGAGDTQPAPERQSLSGQCGATVATSGVLGGHIARTAQNYAPPPASDGIRLVDRYPRAGTDISNGDWFQYGSDDTAFLTTVVKGWKLHKGKVSYSWAAETRDSTGAVVWSKQHRFKEAIRWVLDSAEAPTALVLPMADLPKRHIYYVHLSITDLANGSVTKCVYTIRRREDELMAE